MGKRADRKRPTLAEKKADGTPKAARCCRGCGFWSWKSPKFYHHVIPEGDGRCEKPGGHCKPVKVVPPETGRPITVERPLYNKVAL